MFPAISNDSNVLHVRRISCMYRLNLVENRFSRNTSQSHKSAILGWKRPGNNFAVVGFVLSCTHYVISIMNFTSTWSPRVLYYHLDPLRSQLSAGFQNKWIDINSSMVNWLLLFFPDLLISRAWIESIGWRISELCFSRMYSYFRFITYFELRRYIRSLKYII